MDTPEIVEKEGARAKARSELTKYLRGEKLTLKQAVLANCYSCMGFYADGTIDCLISDCPLYPFMPYKNKAENNLKENMDSGISQKIAS